MSKAILIEGRPISWHIKNKTTIGYVCKRYYSQRERCYNPKHYRYKTYGGKGIVIEYSLKELLTWCKAKGINALKDMDIGRIDHSKSYSLDNILLQSRSENSKESFMRCGIKNPKKEIMISDYTTGENLCIAESTHEAAYLVETTHGNVSMIAGQKRRSAKGFTFRYLT